MTRARARGARAATMAATLALAGSCTPAGDQTSRPVGGGTSPPARALDAAPLADPARAGLDAGAPVAVDAAAGAAIDAGAAPASGAASYAAVLRSADWARWPGLPADLRERDLIGAVGLTGRRARHDGRLGRHHAVIVESRDLRYWLRGGDHVVLIEVTGRLGTTPPADLLGQLGRADRQGAGRFLQAGATTTEHVYAGRGLAITVATSYDTPPAFAPRLAAVQLFAATDLRSFVLELGGNDRPGPRR